MLCRLRQSNVTVCTERLKHSIARVARSGNLTNLIANRPTTERRKLVCGRPVVTLVRIHTPESPVHRIRLYCPYCSLWLEESFLIATATLVLAFEKCAQPSCGRRCHGQSESSRSRHRRSSPKRRRHCRYVCFAWPPVNVYCMDGCTDHCTSALRPLVIAVWSQHTLGP